MALLYLPCLLTLPSSTILDWLWLRCRHLAHVYLFTLWLDPPSDYDTEVYYTVVYQLPHSYRGWDAFSAAFPTGPHTRTTLLAAFTPHTHLHTHTHTALAPHAEHCPVDQRYHCNPCSVFFMPDSCYAVWTPTLLLLLCTFPTPCHLLPYCIMGMVYSAILDCSLLCPIPYWQLLSTGWRILDLQI